MRHDGRLSGVLHLLLHLAETSGPTTSESMARAMSTNPVVIRRLMSGLRDRGLVRSEKGHGGGWTLACDLERVTLRDVYEALEAPQVLAMGHRDGSHGCLVEAAVHARLARSFLDAEAALLASLADVTLAELREDVRARGATRSAAAPGLSGEDGAAAPPCRAKTQGQDA